MFNIFLFNYFYSDQEISLILDSFRISEIIYKYILYNNNTGHELDYKSYHMLDLVYNYGFCVNLI